MTSPIQTATDTPTSDDINTKSPFPENAFVVRSITRDWNAAMGRQEWRLVQQSKANQTQDKRYCVIAEDSQLFQAILAADPRVLNLEKGHSRDLLPTYRVCVKGTGRYCAIEKYVALPIQKAEQQRMDDRAHSDALDDLRKELGLGRAEADDLIRHNFSNNEWWNVAATAMRELAATKAARVKSTEVLKVAEEPEKLDEWFPRDEKGKPVDDPKTDELMQTLQQLADSDELTTPVWSALSVKDNEGQRIAAFKHFAREMSSKDDPANVSDHLLNALNGIPLGECIQVNGIQKVVDYLQKYIDNPQQITKSEIGLEDKQNNSPAIGVHDMQSEAPTAQNASEKPAAVSQLPEAPFSANFKLTHKTGVEIQFTIRASSGAEGMPQIEKAITYLLENGYTTRQQAAQQLPPNATPIGNAPSAHSNDNGTAVCMMIKLARSFTGNKPQLEFEVDGFENPIRYTSDNPGKLAAALKGIRKPDGSEFTAADMTDGRKFVGNWLLTWEKKQKDDKTYTNFVSIAAA